MSIFFKVKISDFGLSRIGATYQMNPKCRVPIRYPRSIHLIQSILEWQMACSRDPSYCNVFTEDWCLVVRLAIYRIKLWTKLYILGIMCWEILNNGQEPYPGMMVAEVHVKVKEGYRMPLEWPGIDSEFVNIIMVGYCRLHLLAYN